MKKIQEFEKRIRLTLLASVGVVQGKTSVGLDMQEEAEKWKAESCVQVGEKNEEWVNAAIPDYEYMKANKLNHRSEHMGAE